MFLFWKCLLFLFSILIKDIGKVEISFLFIEDVLKNFNLVNVEIIFIVFIV